MGGPKLNYGRLGLGGGPRDGHGVPKISAHRASWLTFVGPIPDGMCVLHKCDNPPCVNPDHLFLGTMADNTRDMHAKGRAPVAPGTNTPGNLPAKYDAKLTFDMADEIRRRYAAGGVTHRELAAEFGLSRPSVSRVIRKESWVRS